MSLVHLCMPILRDVVEEAHIEILFLFCASFPLLTGRSALEDALVPFFQPGHDVSVCALNCQLGPILTFVRLKLTSSPKRSENFLGLYLSTHIVRLGPTPAAVRASSAARRVSSSYFRCSLSDQLWHLHRSGPYPGTDLMAFCSFFKSSTSFMSRWSG